MSAAGRKLVDGQGAGPGGSCVCAGMKGPTMKVAMMQPTFLPWQGFFELIYRSERFVLGDDSHSRTRAFTSGTGCSCRPAKSPGSTVPMVKKEAVFKPLHQAKIFEGRPCARRCGGRSIKVMGGRRTFRSSPRRWKNGRTPAESLAAKYRFLPPGLPGLWGSRPKLRSPSASHDPHPIRTSARSAAVVRGRPVLSARGSFGYMKSEGCSPWPTLRFVSGLRP